MMTTNENASGVASTGGLDNLTVEAFAKKLVV